ncbi:serpin family protein [Haloterrigena sp. SYSU A558-1]|uniref:Serpin family protein n=1 Tax=Haloterrigena gelatinilytica TaxID=2741724 RepID=A0ABX2LKN4_9EURY|nr:serpin family protein [Haloterrigena gelatinilytica]NUC73664.1 serpin family protein [Haloterrigena gelatinilytica]
MTADRRRVLALTGALLAGAAGCLGDSTDGEDPANGDENGDEDGALFADRDAPDFPRLDLTTDPDLESDRIAEQIRGNVAVSFDVLAQLREETPDENLFFSPYSVSVALAMTYAGARGETAAEMADALRYDLEGEALHAAFGALEGEFERRNEDGREVESPAWADEDGEGDGSEGDDLGFQLSSANAVWRDEGHDFDDAYVQLLEAYYEAGDHLADFSGSPEAAREEINAWVEERTNDRIEDLLPAGSIDRSTRLVLTNAVYFLAAWEHDFDPADTEPGAFTSLDGSETEVEMMHQSQELRYAEIDGHQLVELPYANGDTSMIVVLPAEGEFESVEASFGVDELAIMLEEASRPKVDLALPKFGIESKFSLVETMRELGMERAFDGGSADFSGMVESAESDLFIDDIIHQSFVEVDEEGTEAAAATAVVVEDTAVADRVEMTVDRPFLFCVRDRPTETPLFVGRVVDGEQLQE